MRTDVAIDKLCNIAPLLAELSDKLAADKEFKAMMNTRKNMNNREFIFKFLPYFINNYREEALNILAVWNEKTVDEVKAQGIGETIAEVKTIFADKDFRSFFSSSSASGSVVDE